MHDLDVVLFVFAFILTAVIIYMLVTGQSTTHHGGTGRGVLRLEPTQKVPRNAAGE